jgi:hypothetical protein
MAIQSGEKNFKDAIHGPEITEREVRVGIARASCVGRRQK